MKTLSHDLRHELIPFFRDKLRKTSEKLDVERAFVTFIDEATPGDSPMFSNPAALIGGKVATIRVNEGLSGQVVKLDRVLTWPKDPESEDAYYSADSNVTTELVAPIHSEGHVVGVVVFDSTKKDLRFGDEEKEIVELCISDLDEKISSIVENKQNLISAAFICCGETASDRGYIAVRTLDGSLAYFHTGRDTYRFLTLSESEGLCGRVLQSGDPINSGNVLDESDYVPSDPLIRSEIIYPILNGDEVIGIVNMESSNKNAYGKKEETRVEKIAYKVAKDANRYRVMLLNERYSDAAWDLLASYINKLNRAEKEATSGGFSDKSDSLEKDFIDILQIKSQSVLHGQESSFWKEDEKKTGLFEKIDCEGASKEVSGLIDSPSEDYTIVFSAVLIDGGLYGICAVKIRGVAYDGQERALRRMCEIASISIRRWRHQRKHQLHIELFHQLVLKGNNESVIELVVKTLPKLLESQHCTLFHKVHDNGEKRLMVTHSTTNMIQEGFCNEPWYLLDGKSGLTPYIAVSQKTLNIKDVTDKNELSKIDYGLEWLGKLSESENSKCRSFLGTPIFDPEISSEDRNVIGVLRIHRDLMSKVSRYGSQDEKTIEMVAYFLAFPLRKYLIDRNWI